jgi:diguanylate cyclase
LDGQLLRIQDLLNGSTLPKDHLYGELDRISSEMFYESLSHCSAAGVATAPHPICSLAHLFDVLRALMKSEEELTSLEVLKMRLERSGPSERPEIFEQIRSGLCRILGDDAGLADSGKGGRTGLRSWLFSNANLERDRLDPAAVRENLMALLESVDLHMAGAGRVEHLHERLRGKGDTESLTILFQEFSELLACLKTAIRSEHERIEAFLADLNRSLADLEETAVGVKTVTLDCASESASLRSFVSGHVENLVCIADAASDLQALKKLLRAKVAAMTRYMDTAGKNQDKAVRKTAALADRMVGRVRDLDIEVEALRVRLRSEHVVAYRDGLTGIANRLAYEERISQDIQRWRRFQLPVSLLVCDVDQFKSINDRFGHKSGDKALVVIAEQLASSIREIDFVARYGGDEFVMILSGTDLPNAYRVCENIRAKVESCPFHTAKCVPVQITVSCGIAQLAEGDTAEALFERADKALYQAKSEGSNRCKGYPPSEALAPLR